MKYEYIADEDRDYEVFGRVVKGDVVDADEQPDERFQPYDGTRPVAPVATTNYLPVPSPAGPAEE